MRDSMRKPVWPELHLDEGILREPSPDANRIIVWIPEKPDGEFRCWERVSNVPGEEATLDEGICAAAATSIRARQRVQGLLGKLLQPFRRSAAAHTWILPNGESAEEYGERQT